MQVEYIQEQSQQIILLGLKLFYELMPLNREAKALNGV